MKLWESCEDKWSWLWEDGKEQYTYFKTTICIYIIMSRARSWGTHAFAHTLDEPTTHVLSTLRLYPYLGRESEFISGDLSLYNYTYILYTATICLPPIFVNKTEKAEYKERSLLC